jgi:hypothetical protein
VTNQPPPPPQGQGWGPANPSEPNQGWGTAPQPGHTEGFGPAGPGTLPPPQKKGGAAKKILGLGGGVLVAVIVAIIIAVVRGVLSDDATAEAKQGDCIADVPEVATGQDASAPDVKIVECASAEAKYSVVARVDGVTEAQATADTMCADNFKEGEEYAVFRAIPTTGGKGYVLCLKPA